MTDAAYSEILVPTDGSDLALRALDEALRVGGTGDATIHVLYVVDDATVAEVTRSSGVDDVSVGPDVNRTFDRYEAAGERAIEEVRDAAAERGVDVAAGVRRGFPAEEILAYARENDVDVIVMGTHGRRGIERYLLGSTTERVLRRAPVPVVAVRD
ncbi:MAG: universal stress protein [Haloarculaceae archaeon]